MKHKRALIGQIMAFGAGIAMIIPVGIGNAFAQEDDDTQDDGLEEVVVTGSRIKRANLTSSSPVTQVDADEFLYGGITRAEDLLNDLPQVSASNTAGDSNGASGTATVDLRGLDTVRTLALLNGRRLPAGSPAGNSSIATDLNQIPVMLIDRVEVLTGGASATYGSDAVAGVVNFIMKDDFEGFQVSFQHSFYQHSNDSSVASVVRDTGFDLPSSSVSDGNTNDISILLGTNTGDGRGNITAYASYRDIEAVTQSERDYSACALGGSPDAFSCGGSSTIPSGRFTDFGTLSSTGPGSFDYIVDGNDFVPRAGNPNGLYNYAPLNYFQRPDKRSTFGAIGHYKFNEKAELYSELSFMDDRSLAQIAPSGAFFVTSSLNCSNPLLSPQQFQLICGDYGLTTADSQSVFIGRRNVEGGPRQDDLRHTAYRMVLGFRGDINDTWSYDVFANFGKVSYVETYRNDLSTVRIARALNVVPDPVTGDPVCQSVVDGSDSSCVPWNVFQSGAVSQAAINYLTLPLYARGDTKQSQISGYLNGDLDITLPKAKEGIKLVAGYEFREEQLIFEPDNGFASGDGAGQGGPIQAVDGKFDVKEIFTEASIPLLEGSSIAERIALEVGYRYSDYSTDKKTDTFKIAAEWVVDPTLRFRSSIQHAVRAGNIRELFRPATIGLFDMDEDPCAGPTPTATLEQCARTGVTPAQYGTISDSPAGQYNEISGGNPNLDPEESDTVSLGFLLSPESVPGLTLSIDYFDIEIEDAIDSIDSEFSLNQCLETGDPLYCDLITRGAATGTLWIGQDNIRSTDVNIGFIKTSGFDINSIYEVGNFRFSLVGTLLKTWDEQNVPGGPTVDCVAVWGGTCGRPRPKWVHNLRATWVSPWDMLFSASWRHMGSVDDMGNNNADFSSQDYLDVAALWNMSEKINFRFGINNLLDKDPPLTADAGPSIYGNGNTFPGIYDALGRYIFAGATLSY